MIAAIARRHRAHHVAIVGAALLVACSPQGLDSREEALVQLYLTCYDCTSPLDSVRAFAVRKPAATVDSLNVALVRGPDSSATRDSASVVAFIRDSSYRATHARPPLPVNRLDYMLENRRRFDGGFRTRAAIALGWIHDPRALADLNTALGTPLPPDLRAAVKFALDSLP